jgi:UvrD/REP helicase N-terminal domain
MGWTDCIVLLLLYCSCFCEALLVQTQHKVMLSRQVLRATATWRPACRRHAVLVCSAAKQHATAAAAELDKQQQEQDGLNNAQHSAVTAPLGAMRVVAGPGSGKTRVLTRRIAHLIEVKGAPPWSIMAVTFTNKAAEEMRKRVESIVGRAAARDVSMGTFHSVCSKLLRRFGTELGGLVPGLSGQFTIYDTDDCKRIVKDLMATEKFDSTTIKIADVCSAISRAKSQGKGPAEVTAEVDGILLQSQSTGSRARTQFRDLMECVAQIYPIYQAELSRLNALDFDDLILLTLRLLQQNTDVFDAVGRKYRYVFIPLCLTAFSLSDRTMYMHLLSSKKGCRSSNVLC